MLGNVEYKSKKQTIDAQSCGPKSTKKTVVLKAKKKKKVL